jgi:hypothetical protein
LDWPRDGFRHRRASGLDRPGRGGEVERAGVGKMKVTGPQGTVTINEPTSDSRKDVARNSAARLILEKTGLKI